MTLISLRAVDARPLEQVVFGASIGIPLPETLEEMHNYSLRGGVLGTVICALDATSTEIYILAAQTS